MLADDITNELPYLRAEAESLMLDAGTALHPTGEGLVYDEIAQLDVEATTPLFDSRCKIQTRTLQARESEVGGRTSVEVRTELHLPASTAPLAADDLWEITATHPLSLSSIGQRLRIVGPVAGTLKTARRYEVTEVVS